MRRDLSDERTTLLGLFNLSLDPWPSVTWQLNDRRNIRSLQLLTREGLWSPDDRLLSRRSASSIDVCALMAVPYDNPLFVQVQWS